MMNSKSIIAIQTEDLEDSGKPPIQVIFLKQNNRLLTME